MYTCTHTHTSSLPFLFLGEGKVKVGGVTLADSIDLPGTLYSEYLGWPARGDFGYSFGLLCFPCSELCHILVFILNDRDIPTTWQCWSLPQFCGRLLTGCREHAIAEKEPVHGILRSQ